MKNISCWRRNEYLTSLNSLYKGKRVGCFNAADPNELGYTDGKNVYIGIAHPYTAKMSTADAAEFWTGINAHEMGHMLWTNFKATENLLNQIANPLEREFAQQICNMCEDPAIEGIGLRWYIDELKKALAYSIRSIHRQTPPLGKEEDAVNEVTHAMILYGDGGLKGKFYNAEAETCFNNIVKPAMDKICSEMEGSKRVEMGIKLSKDILKALQITVPPIDVFVQMWGAGAGNGNDPSDGQGQGQGQSGGQGQPQGTTNGDIQTSIRNGAKGSGENGKSTAYSSGKPGSFEPDLEAIIAAWQPTPEEVQETATEQAQSPEQEHSDEEEEFIPFEGTTYTLVTGASDLPYYQSVVTAEEETIRQVIKGFKRLESMVQEYTIHERFGNLNINRFISPIRSSYIFDQTVERPTFDTWEVWLLVDTSGSMYGRRITGAIHACTIMHEALKRVGIKHHVYGFSYGSKFQKCETADTIGGLRQSVGGGTDTADCIRFFTGTQVKPSKALNKVIFVISDDECDDGTVTVEVKKSQKLATVYGLTIADSNRSDRQLKSTQSHYGVKNASVVTNTNEIALEVPKIVHTLIKRAIL